MAKTFEIDASEFERGLKRLMERAFPLAVERALAEAGGQVLNDAVMQVPSVPLDEGTLRGSGSVFVQNRLTETSESLGSNGTPCRDHVEAIGRNEFVAVIGFNTPYAAYQHEGVRADGSHPVVNYSEPGSGPKFLEAKLIDQKEVYGRVIAARIKKELGG